MVFLYAYKQLSDPRRCSLIFVFSPASCLLPLASSPPHKPHHTQHLQLWRRRKEQSRDPTHIIIMAARSLLLPPPHVYLVMMEYDPEYERLRAYSNRSAAHQLDRYVSNKHDMLLQKTLKPGTYKKRFSWVIVDGFAAEITPDQADMLRSADGVRVVEKDHEISM